MSKNSTNKNDENLIEIRNNPALGQLYLAEFMRLFKHYRARALWEYFHGPHPRVAVRSGSEADPLVLKRTRDG